LGCAAAQELFDTKEQEAADLAVGLTYELHDPQQRGMLEIDGSCVEFDSQSRCCGAVYFADKEDAENGIIHYGLHWGDLGSYAQADDDQIRFNLSKIQPHIHVLFFVVTFMSRVPGTDSVTVGSAASSAAMARCRTAKGRCTPSRRFPGVWLFRFGNHTYRTQCIQPLPLLGS